MTDVHKETLRRNIVELAQNMKVSGILGDLVVAKVLNENECEKIEAQDTSMEKSQLFLLNIFLAKADWAFDELVIILRRNSREHLADLLDPPSELR